ARDRIARSFTALLAGDTPSSFHELLPGVSWVQGKLSDVPADVVIVPVTDRDQKTTAECEEVMNRQGIFRKLSDQAMARMVDEKKALQEYRDHKPPPREPTATPFSTGSLCREDGPQVLIALGQNWGDNNRDPNPWSSFLAVFTALGT